MPAYTYECDACFRTFETTQRMADLPLTTCPSCAGPVHRIIFPATLSFHGSGWTPRGPA